jgi:hypothetical protein
MNVDEKEAYDSLSGMRKNPGKKVVHPSLASPRYWTVVVIVSGCSEGPSP